MNDILAIIIASVIFFGAIGLRGLFGYFKNKKADSAIEFDRDKFVRTSLWTGLKIGAFGALGVLSVALLWLVDWAGIQVQGIEQIQPHTILIGIVIAAIGALGLAMKEGFASVFGLTEEQIRQVQEVAQSVSENPDSAIGIDIGAKDGTVVATATEVRQDAGTGEVIDSGTLAQMGAFPYYVVDTSTPDKFFNAVNGKGFDEGFGLQCVAGFKQFTYALSGRIVATATGGASGYAQQRSQIEPLGFTYSTDRNLQDGDWVVFGGGQYGHIAMYYKGQFFGQNQGAADVNRGNAFNLANVSLANYLCHYRPNKYKKTTPAPAPTPAPTPTVPPANSAVKKGSTVRPLKAVDYNGISLASFVTERDYPVIELKGDRAVLGNGLNTAFRTGNLKVVGTSTTKPADPGFKVGDTVAPIAPVSYDGEKLTQWDSKYTISELIGNRAVLKARGAVWAAVNTSNLRKA